MAVALNKNKAGLALGLFAVICHVLWAIVVAVGFAQPLLDWTVSLHMINSPVTVTGFEIGSAVIFVVLGFIKWYIAGWILAALFNFVSKK